MNRIVGVLVGLTLLAGCGGKSEDEWTKNRKSTVRVTGVVTYNGEPIEGAAVTFQSSEQQIAAVGATDADGEFTLKTYEDGDGAVVGPHTVTIMKVESKYPEGVNPDEYSGGPEEVWHLPKKYSTPRTSGLTATVTEDGDNHFEFALTDG